MRYPPNTENQYTGTYCCLVPSANSTVFIVMTNLLHRIACYTAITTMLQQLLDASRTHVPPTHSPVKPGPPSPQPANQNQPPTPKQQVKFK